MRDAEGVRVGNRFLVGEILGGGSFSDVYAALDETTGTPVALKVIGRGASDDALMEASLLSAVRHPNVVAFYAAGRETTGPFTGRTWIAMQMADRTLADYVDSAGDRLPWAVVRPIVVDILRGLAYLHDQKPPILHRDIKPDNVLDFGGRWALGDLGISTGGSTPSHGARSYTAPEVLAGGAASVQSDLWSVGELIKRCVGNAADEPLDPASAALVESLGSPNVTERPDSALRALNVLVPKARSSVTPTHAPRHAQAGDDTLEPSMPHRPNRRRIVSVVAAVALVVASIGAIRLLGGSDKPRLSAPSVSSSPTTTEPSAAEFQYEWFAAPSGNIGCRVTPEFARCDINQFAFAAPERPPDCDGNWGHTLILEGEGEARFACTTDSELGSPSTLQYGRVNQVGRYLCRSEDTSGITCIDTRTGYGFQVKKASYRFLP